MMRAKFLTFLLTILAPLSAQSFAATSVESRAEHFNQLLLGGNISNYLDVNLKTKIEGTRYVLTVIPGVLYRGGGAHGKNPLTSTALNSLCEAGFSLAVYAYDVGYRDPGVISCTTKQGQPNQLRYIAGRANSTDFKDRFLRLVQEVISNPEAGPIFEHCWNGNHASGELAAVALRQFCGWSTEAAQAYWTRHAAGAPMISRIRKFSPIGGLSIPGNQMGALCGQTR